jgi:hypothetical protein
LSNQGRRDGWDVTVYMRDMSNAYEILIGKLEEEDHMV